MALPIGPRMIGFHQDGLEIPARPISEAAPAESWHQCLISSWETNHHHLSSANITITITITNHHHLSSFINHHQPSTSIINHHHLSSADDSAICLNTITNTIINTNKKTNIISKNEFCFFIGLSCLKHISYHWKFNLEFECCHTSGYITSGSVSPLICTKNPLDLRMSAK